MTAADDLLKGENEDLRTRLNAALMKQAELQQALDGMVTDMSLMEARIAELEGTPDLP